MYIRNITIKNFRLFQDSKSFNINDINVPDGINEGSGLSVFVGENSCGKTSLLDAIALPLLSYKADAFSISDLNNPDTKAEIRIFSDNNFEYKATVGSTKYIAKGFEFEAGIRNRGNKNYLSSIIVNDQRFIKADGEVKPNDDSPDLRTSVNNPWSGQRFSENDVMYLDKNRTYQIRSGTYNLTRFDRLMEDFNLQYIKQNGNPIDCNEKLRAVKIGIENAFLQNAIEKFKEISNEETDLYFLDDYKPYKDAFFAKKTAFGQLIQLGNMGTGYEMIFSLIYSFYLSQQSGKQLIALIDEPDLHLHPKLQRDFLEILLEFSKSAQIIVTTHSPLFVKQALENELIKLCVLRKEASGISIADVGGRVLPYLSSNEINFIAFGLATEEYHNELYEEIKYKNGPNTGIKSFDTDYFINLKGEGKTSPWMGKNNEVSVHTYIRNQIHHQKENGKVNYRNLESSIEVLRKYI